MAPINNASSIFPAILAGLFWALSLYFSINVKYLFFSYFYCCSYYSGATISEMCIDLCFYTVIVSYSYSSNGLGVSYSKSKKSRI